MAEFVYNNTKNANTGHMSFELNCSYHPQDSFKDNINLCSRSCSANKLAKELKELIDICQQNLLHTQELQKRANDKGMKSQNYTLGENFWLNSKYIKTKRNQKLKAKFFGPFQILHPVGKQE